MTTDAAETVADGSAAPLVVRTASVEGTLSADLLSLLPSDDPVCWVRGGTGLVGWGVAARVRTTGATRFADADAWWQETTARAIVRDEVDEPGSGLVCFGSFAFAAEPGHSTLVVPQVLVGSRGGRTWVTTIGHGPAPVPDLRVARPAEAPGDVAFAWRRVP